MARLSRRAFLGLVAIGGIGAGAAILTVGRQNAEKKEPLTLYTFGDSILDCGHYNQYGVTPGQLLVKNNDELFPEFRGKDLSTRGPAKLVHRARDGATVDGLPDQARALQVEENSVAIITIGGNDLLRGLLTDRDGEKIEAFGQKLQTFLQQLPIKRVLLANLYDPTFGDDSNNFAGVDPALGRANHQRVNETLAKLAAQHGQLVDLHAHFLTGKPDWFTHTIEPGVTGASEVRRVFLRHLL